MAKKKAAAKAEGGEAIPDKPKKPAPEGIPQELWDSWALPHFDTGPNGEVTPEEQAAVDAQAELIRAFRKEQRRPAEEAEKAQIEAKEKRAAEKRQKAAEQAATVADLVRRVTAIEEKVNG
jgi:hypothetical protein